MKKGSQTFLLVGALLLAIAPAQAADRAVRMQRQKPLAKGVDAMPLIADPADDAETRINAALQRFDASLRKGIAACAADAREAHVAADWQRSVAVTMAGPGFLSLTIEDSTFCGGAYPNTGTTSIVYDLQSGRPVDWTKLLPASLTGTVALQESPDGTKLVTLASRRLFELYRAGYRSGAKADDDLADCKQAIADAGADAPPPMMVWLDAKAGGLAMQFDLPHVVEACADPETIPTATLQREGASPRLVAALQAAHKG